MKLSFALASALLLPVGVLGHSGSSTHEAKPTASPSSVSSELPASQPVRITVSPTSGFAPASTDPATPAPALQSPLGATEQQPLLELASPLGWSAPVLSLREIPIYPARHPSRTELQHLISRIARPSTPGFTGFLLGFCNLLNPFAPSSLGVETSGMNWYDGDILAYPLPWGFRDERFHEPQTPEFSIELSRLFGLESEKPEPRPTLQAAQGALLTYAP